MTDTTYFWQGGRRVSIEHKDNDITIETADVEEAYGAAARAGVAVTRVISVGERMTRMIVRGGPRAGHGSAA